ncbi:hypothetical protein [Wenzhouxiangella sp. EGI_FJ10305]|uniref:hypothetical protein n=1 Tax=Wenzhouxiangella sp. EGI_FJ10305 TaxID=3243768 RepID=UPI0035E16997
MNHDRKATQSLVDRLLGAGGEALSATELDAALSWLAGSSRHGGGALKDVLGDAPNHPRRRVAIYEQLDRQIFHDGQIDLIGVHLDVDVNDETRRARYRRLMTAFHPDRYPEHADWLTSRSQAVHASYARFRKGLAPEHRATKQHEPSATQPAKPPRHPRPNERRGRRSARLTPAAGPGPLIRLRSWLLGIENLQQRIFIGLAVVCLVPVLYAYFAYKPYRAIDMPNTPISETAPQPTADVKPADTRSGPGTERQPAPDSQAAWTALSDWTVPLFDAASEGVLETQQDPRVASAAERGRHAEPAKPTVDAEPTPPQPRPTEPLSESTVSNEVAAVQQAPVTPKSTGEEAAQRRRSLAETARTLAAVDDGSETASEPAETTTPEPVEQPAPGSDIAPENEAGPSRSNKPVAEDQPERRVAGTTTAEPARKQRGQADERNRRHIEELLAGYRRSFENGWLEDFLNHFTESPRENLHEGRDWFRSNYGWLFENSEQRRLDIDILDIDRTDDQWSVEAQFQMNIDFPDQPSLRSNRKVHYRIESNDHEQLRIAAIEY